MTRLKSVFYDSKGSATLEASVMFILILFLIVGFVYLTNAVTVYSVAQTAAREGAREYAMTDSNTMAVRKARTELEMGGVDPGSASIVARAEGQERRVTVSIRCPLFVPVVGERELIIQGGATFRRVRYGR